MSTVIMPQLGETVAEGKILAWFKSVGDEIRQGDNLFEVETDKVTIEVQSIVDGRLNEIRVPAGAVAKVGAVVAVVGGETATPAPSAKSAEPPAKAMSPFEEVRTPTQDFGPAKTPDGVRVTPLARRLIAQNNLDLPTLAATAKAAGSTRIDERAVRDALQRPASPAKAPPSPQSLSSDGRLSTPYAGEGRGEGSPPRQPTGEIIALNTMRQRTGERLAENWRTIPHVFQAIEVDFTDIDRLRQRHKAAFQAQHGFALTFLPFIARATCLAISAYPQINARLDAGKLILSRDIHLGIAVDLDHDGLIVPVVRDAGDLSLIGLAKAMRRQIDKARSNKLTADDLSGGTYSLSNNGAFGTSFTAPIINAPQVAILSTDAIKLKPGIVETPQGPFVAPRMIGMVGQSFDHRAFDGAYSGAFLQKLKSILEKRNWAEEIGA